MVLPEYGREAVRRLQVEVDHVDHAEDADGLVVELPGPVDARLHRVPGLATAGLSWIQDFGKLINLIRDSQTY